MKCQKCKCEQLVTMHGDSVNICLTVHHDLKTALDHYDMFRSRYGYEGAERNASDPSFASKYLIRLVKGLASMSMHSIAMTVHSSDNLLSYQYIKDSGYFTSLMGLFYFNGSEQAVKSVLQKAWKRGGKRNKQI